MKKLLLILGMTVASQPAFADANANVHRNAQKTIQEYHRGFTSVDIDRSGKISRDELFFAAEKTHARIDANKDGYVTDIEYIEARPGTGLFMARQKIALIDINKDNRVSLREARLQSLHALVNDKNQDGLLSFSEVMKDAPPAIKRYFEKNYANGS